MKKNKKPAKKPVVQKKAPAKKSAPVKKATAKVKIVKPAKSSEVAKDKSSKKPVKWTVAKPAPKKLPVVKVQKIKSIARSAEKKAAVKKLAPISIEIVDYASKGLTPSIPKVPVVSEAKLDTRPIVPSPSAIPAVPFPDHEPTVAEVQAQINASRPNTLGAFAGFSPIAI